MKKIILIMLVLPLALFSCCSDNTIYSNNPQSPKYIVLDKEPEFPGGMNGLIKYLSANIKYPEEARYGIITGRVVVAFVVEKDGKVTSARVLEDIGGGCGEEAIRVVENMPRWSPAEYQGKKVRVLFTLPINFNLK